jgi:hypothetical protein
VSVTINIADEELYFYTNEKEGKEGRTTPKHTENMK